MSWMATYTGQKFWVQEPAKTKIVLEDIAHAQSMLCRFGGHMKEFYSVAQHSIFVADIVAFNGGDYEEQLWGLMHDSGEAYLIDLPTPIKIEFQEKYEALERKIVRAIQDQLGLPPLVDDQLPLIVKQADRIALVTEARQLMTNGTKEWQDHYQAIESAPVSIRPMSPGEAKAAFLQRYVSLMEAVRNKQ